MRALSALIGDAIDVAVREPRSDNSRYALACRHW
jgi:hypothetical protein